MKKIVLLVLALTVLMAFAGCGKDNSDKADEDDSGYSESFESSETEASGAEETTLEDGFKKVGKEINDPQKPEVTKVELSGKYEGDIRGTVSIENLYNVDYLHSGVVGLVGAPIEITYDETMEDARLTFYYNKDELRGIPEDNLLFLEYNEEQYCYEEIYGFKLDRENCTISIPIIKSGVYMLVDAYQWLDCWGYDVSKYEYDTNPVDYASDWERECDTGSIMEIADIDWAMENAPYFNVSTPEQLAGVVYYVNAVADYFESMYIALEDDIDLAGYEWVPMGWNGAGNNSFSGIIYGQGHTISNLTMNVAYSSNIGLIGYGNGVEIYDLNIVDAKINGGSRSGIIGGEVYGDIECINVNVSGEITATGQIGSFFGREVDLYCENCTADVMVNGEKFEYFSDRQKTIAETEVVEAFTLTLGDDNCITRDVVSGYDNLTWHIDIDGRTRLERGAEDELILDTHKWVGNDPGKYTIYLEAFIDGTYIRVSNIIEYEI